MFGAPKKSSIEGCSFFRLIAGIQTGAFIFWKRKKKGFVRDIFARNTKLISCLSQNFAFQKKLSIHRIKRIVKVKGFKKKFKWSFYQMNKMINNDFRELEIEWFDDSFFPGSQRNLKKIFGNFFNSLYWKKQKPWSFTKYLFQLSIFSSLRAVLESIHNRIISLATSCVHKTPSTYRVKQNPKCYCRTKNI